ncbi:hypothetical protein Strvi_0871 [Streptomyces violaceusniger Tu 4113]|uniref:Uncharacterized protein n=1 Tax=Streptomyces violaceusniger (strain Tu 4113) TaxID=653045 RepID=G2PBM0_STRV4|nr:hypothetical protein Strvi_0871 [Streptomyces violaceusniger Tu 4113]
MEIYEKDCDTPDRVGRKWVEKDAHATGSQSVTRDRTTK